MVSEFVLSSERVGMVGLGLGWGYLRLHLITFSGCQLWFLTGVWGNGADLSWWCSLHEGRDGVDACGRHFVAVVTFWRLMWIEVGC